MEETYYIFTNGSLARKDNTLRFISEDGNKRDLPIENISDRDLNKYVSYQYLMRLEVFKLIKHLTGEKEYTGFEIWW